MDLQDVDTRLKKLLANCQNREKMLEQLIEEGGMKDEKLENEFERLRIDTQAALTKQNEIRSDIALIEDKLLQNPDMPLGDLKACDDKMKQDCARIKDLAKVTDTLEGRFQDKEKEYGAFVQKVEDHYKNKRNNQIDENVALMDKIAQLQKDLGGKVDDADKKLAGIELTEENMVDPMIGIKTNIGKFLAKNKQVTAAVNTEKDKLAKFQEQEKRLQPDYILNHVHLGVELEKQHERLKKTLDEDLKDMADLLKDILDGLKDLEKLIDDNSKGTARGKLNDLKKLGDAIDNKIAELQDRIDAIQDELAKLDPNEHGNLIDAL